MAIFNNYTYWILGIFRQIFLENWFLIVFQFERVSGLISIFETSQHKFLSFNVYQNGERHSELQFSYQYIIHINNRKKRSKIPHYLFPNIVFSKLKYTVINDKKDRLWSMWIKYTDIERKPNWPYHNLSPCYEKKSVCF